MFLKDPRFKSFERIFTIDFSQNQICRYACLSVPNCKVLENILAQHKNGMTCQFLRMLTVVKCRDHTKFVISKIYEGYFQLTYNLVHLR